MKQLKHFNVKVPQNTEQQYRSMCSLLQEMEEGGSGGYGTDRVS